MYKVVELFSGAGGTAWGFKKAGFMIIGAIDNDEDATQTYKHNIGITPKTEDIRNVEPDKYREELGLERGELDILVGCPPCQGFTRMRNNNGKEDERNDLVITYLGFVLEFRPKFIVFENVPGIIKTDHGKVYYDALKKGLKEAGYTVVDKIVNAADYGVPQRRKRVIVIAARYGRPPDIPKPTHGKPTSKDVVVGKLDRWRTVEDSIKHYPKLEAGKADENIANHVARSMGDRVAEFISLVPHDGGSRTDVPKKKWLDCHKKNPGHRDVYGRLSWDGLANVITSGCTNVSKGRFAHPEQNRGLTPREAAALQGFPDEFEFFGSVDSIARQIGNAVPPPLAFAIAKAIKEVLDTILENNGDKYFAADIADKAVDGVCKSIV